MNVFEQKLTELQVYGFAIVEDVLSEEAVSEMRDYVQQAEQQMGVESRHRAQQGIWRIR